jgi:hypothetical protein
VFNKYRTVACGECHVVCFGNTEPSSCYYDNGSLRVRWLKDFELCLGENA